MEQLKMYWLPGTPVREAPLPDGYSISRYRTDADKLAWCECCKNGLVADDADEKAFQACIGGNPDIDVHEDVFFLDHAGEHIGTVTAFVHKATGTGDMHMVGIRTDYRGRGLSRHLTALTVKKLSAQGVRYISLTTDEWRKNAIRSYLSGGFLPVEYADGMEERWLAVLTELGFNEVQMLRDDATPFKILRTRP